MNGLSARFKRTQVLIASDDEVDRVVLESGLVRAGYLAVFADNVDAAVTRIKEGGIDAIISDIGLTGGGAFSLMRRLRAGGQGAPPAVGISAGPIDHEVRRIGEDCGMLFFLEAPLCRGAVQASLERAIATAHAGRSPQMLHEFIGSLQTWSVADLCRHMAFFRASGVISASRREGRGTVSFRLGAPTHAALGELTGERALFEMLSWSEGSFSVRRGGSPDGGAGRNVHRALADILVAGVPRTTGRHRQVVQLPGLELPHRLDLRAADSRNFSGALVTQLARVLDGQRTLREALQEAQVDSNEGLELVLAMIRQAVIRPVTGMALEAPRAEPAPAPESPRALDLEIQQTVNRASLPGPSAEIVVKKSGTTVTRTLGFKRKSHKPDDFAELVTYQDRREQKKQRSLVGWLALAGVLTAILLGYLAFRDGGNSDAPQVRILDDAGSSQTP